MITRIKLDFGREVVLKASHLFNYSLRDIKSKDRNHRLVQIRCFIAKYLIDKGFTQDDTKRILNYKDHSSVINLLKEFEYYKDRYVCGRWDCFVKYLDDSDYFEQCKPKNDCIKSDVKQSCLEWLESRKSLKLTPTLIDQFEMLPIWK